MQHFVEKVMTLHSKAVFFSSSLSTFCYVYLVLRGGVWMLVYFFVTFLCQYYFIILLSGEKDKEKKHKKKLSMGNANITNLLSSPSSTTKNTLTSGTISSPAQSASVVSQGLNSASTSQSSPAKSLNSQLSNHGIVKTEPANSVMVHVNGNNSVAATENMSSTQPDKVVSASANTLLQNGIQSGEGNLEIVEPTLPQCLPADLESCILRLKQAGSDSGTEGKCKFFNSDVNHMLLE